MTSRKPKPRKVWVYAPTITEAEMREIVAACERFIAEVLKPRFLPEVRPTEWNYPVDIRGRWRANRYRFVQRYCSDRPDAIKPEFDAPFACIEWTAPGTFNVAWHRHTGEWRTLFTRVPLEEALRLIETEGLLHPP
ncbi:hypothetical protein [Azospirillum sp.]|uniref:DUF3024 domain-containing protein n=1 Tax=Azospirillum sp. TaxID=34012 RepID=UPI003D70693A